MSELTDEQVAYIEEKERERELSLEENSSEEAPKEEKKPSFVFKLLAIIGFCSVMIGCILDVLGLLYSFLPTMQTTMTTLLVLFGMGLGLIFVGVILIGIGMKAAKLLSRFAFFFAALGILISAAMIVIIVCFQKVVPLPAWERMYTDANLVLNL